MTEPFQPATSAEHAAHDPMWMAALASRDHDLSPTEHTRAQAALETCDACADLFAELVAVSAAIPSAATPARPREFTLTPADAARLRTRGLRRWLSAIGSARDGITFPLAMGLTTMGIAGLLLATLPSAFSGATSMTTLSTVGAPLAPAGDAEGAAAAPSAAGAAPSAAAAAASDAPIAQSTELYSASGGPARETTGEGAFTGDDGDGTGVGHPQDATEMAIPEDRSGFSALALLATSILLAGLGLFALRWSARRL